MSAVHVCHYAYSLIHESDGTDGNRDPHVFFLVLFKVKNELELVESKLNWN